MGRTQGEKKEMSPALSAIKIGIRRTFLKIQAGVQGREGEGEKLSPLLLRAFAPVLKRCTHCVCANRRDERGALVNDQNRNLVKIFLE